MTPEPDDTLFDAIEFGILGQDRDLTRLDVVAETGESLERIEALWRALGFPAAGDEERRFTDADVEAVRTFTGLVDVGFVDPDGEVALARSMGRSFARLAEWEVGVMAALLAGDDTEPDPLLVKELLARILPAVEQIQDYVWRRHLAAAAGRLLLQPPDLEGGSLTSVGFADIVGFTRRSRELTQDQLAQLVEHFEQTVTTVITEHGGHTIKTIGDEVLFVADSPLAAARIGLTLATGHDRDEEFPVVRVGLAHGEVLRRLGDVFGEVVNIAARLTSVAKPGKVLVDRGMADALADHGEEEFRVRRLRSTSVKGYSRLELFALKPPKASSDAPELPEGLQQLPEPAVDVLESLAGRFHERRTLRTQKDT